MSLTANDDISFFVVGTPPDTERIRLKDTSGQTIKPEQNIVTVPLAQKLNLEPGDSVKVFNTEGGKEHVFVIEQIADTYADEFLFMPHLLKPLLRASAA